jgi:branched-chain amino acid transport system ATP-binding protein
MLELHDVAAHYGRSQALFSVSLTVNAGEAVAVLGANAAGKSTTLKCISRIMPRSAGSILLEGQDIAKWSPRRIVETGVIQIPEGRQVFPFMTVLENLQLGSQSRRAKPHRRESLEQVFEWLPVLKDRSKQLAGTLSGGEQQMLAIGRAMMARPSLLMLDEPSLGLSPVMVQRVFEIIGRLKSAGLTLLLVEQNMVQALHVVDRAYVVETGVTVIEGTAQDLMADPAIRRAYFGGDPGVPAESNPSSA